MKKTPMQKYVALIIKDYKAGIDNPIPPFSDLYKEVREDYDFSKRNHDLKFIERCAQQDFNDGEDACVYPEHWAEAHQ